MMVSGFGFRVSGFGFRVQGLEFRAQGLGFRVWNCAQESTPTGKPLASSGKVLLAEKTSREEFDEAKEKRHHWE